jgi:hypothetical protein
LMEWPDVRQDCDVHRVDWCPGDGVALIPGTTVCAAPGRRHDALDPGDLAFPWILDSPPTLAPGDQGIKVTRAARDPGTGRNGRARHQGDLTTMVPRCPWRGSRLVGPGPPGTRVPGRRAGLAALPAMVPTSSRLPAGQGTTDQKAQSSQGTWIPLTPWQLGLSLPMGDRGARQSPACPSRRPGANARRGPITGGAGGYAEALQGARPAHDHDEGSLSP